MRINGTGTTYLGFSPRNVDESRMATLWFTLFFLPVKPLKRARLRLLQPRGSGMHVEELEETPLDAGEVWLTRLYGWLLFPLLLLWPLPFGVMSVPYLERGGGPWWTGPAPIVSIIWVCAAAWMLLDWHERRATPRKVVKQDCAH